MSIAMFYQGHMHIMKKGKKKAAGSSGSSVFRVSAVRLLGGALRLWRLWLERSGQETAGGREGRYLLWTLEHRQVVCSCKIRGVAWRR